MEDRRRKTLPGRKEWWGIHDLRTLLWDTSSGSAAEVLHLRALPGTDPGKNYGYPEQLAEDRFRYTVQHMVEAVARTTNEATIPSLQSSAMHLSFTTHRLVKMQVMAESEEALQARVCDACVRGKREDATKSLSGNLRTQRNWPGNV